MTEIHLQCHKTRAEKINIDMKKIVSVNNCCTLILILFPTRWKFWDIFYFFHFTLESNFLWLTPEKNISDRKIIAFDEIPSYQRWKWEIEFSSSNFCFALTRDARNIFDCPKLAFSVNLSRKLNACEWEKNVLNIFFFLGWQG